MIWNDSFICETRDEFIVPLQLRVSAPASVADARKRAALWGQGAAQHLTFSFRRRLQHKWSVASPLDCAASSGSPRFLSPADHDHKRPFRTGL